MKTTYFYFGREEDWCSMKPPSENELASQALTIWRLTETTIDHWVGAEERWKTMLAGAARYRYICVFRRQNSYSMSRPTREQFADQDCFIYRIGSDIKVWDGEWYKVRRRP